VQHPDERQRKRGRGRKATTKATWWRSKSPGTFARAWNTVIKPMMDATNMV
jgi:hypothetical protein